MNQTQLDDALIQTIRDEVKKGKYKIEVAIEHDLSYWKVKQYTKGIPTILGIPPELEQRIKDEVNKGKSKRQVARELHICRDTVQKYTRNMPRKPFIWRKRSKEEIELIQQTFRNCKSKTETAKLLGLTYWAVRWHTRDIIIHRSNISAEVREKIRDKVKNGKLKTQVAKEMNQPLHVVLRCTKDIYLHPRKADISPKAFLMLQELVDKGYVFPCNRYGLKEYKMLKNEIPKLYKIRMKQKTIFFFEDKSDVAARAFLMSLKRRITNYYELKQVIDVFKVHMKKEYKSKYI